MPQENLNDSVRIFSDTYGYEPSEKSAYNNCFLVAEKLDAAAINFALFDGGFYIEVLVGEEDCDKIKEIAQASRVKAWIEYLERSLNPKLRN